MLDQRVKRERAKASYVVHEKMTELINVYI